MCSLNLWQVSVSWLALDEDIDIDSKGVFASLAMTTQQILLRLPRIWGSAVQTSGRTA